MLKLWQRLFLAIAVLIVAAMAAMVLIQQYEFRAGFREYVFALDRARAEQIVERLQTFYAEQGDWSAIRQAPGLMRHFASGEDPLQLDDWRRPGRRQNQLGMGPANEPPRFGERPLRPRAPAPEFNGQVFPFLGPKPPPSEPAAPPAGERPGPGPEWMARLSLFDESGQVLHGAPFKLKGGASLPLTVNEQIVGELYLQPAPQLRDEPAQDFVRKQSWQALWIALAILGLALLLSYGLARRLLSPLPNISAAVNTLAQGQYELQLSTGGVAEFEQLSEDVRRLSESLQAHQRSRQQWIADIAHELRTPVTILQGEMEALDDGVRPFGPQALQSLRAETERLRSLIGDLYQLALSDAGALDYRFEAVDLGVLLRERCELQRAHLAQAGLELICGEIPMRILVRADRERLQQLLANLLGNSARYTDAPGQIAVSLRVSGKQARIAIEDSKPGVPDAALPRLFERLYRVESSRSRDHGGAGLGLAIAASIVKAHGGRIVARHSTLGGLGIDIDLPLWSTPT